MKKLNKSEKEKRGTYRKDKEPNQTKPDGAIDYVPVPPVFLKGEAVRIYFTVAEDRLKNGWLFLSDLEMIVTYSAEMAKYYQLAEVLEKEGYTYENKNGETHAHPALRLQRAALESATKLAKLLSISPYFRSRQQASNNAEKTKEFDPMDDIVGEDWGK